MKYHSKYMMNIQLVYLIRYNEEFVDLNKRADGFK